MSSETSFSQLTFSQDSSQSSITFALEAAEDDPEALEEEIKELIDANLPHRSLLMKEKLLVELLELQRTGFNKCCRENCCSNFDFKDLMKIRIDASVQGP